MIWFCLWGLDCSLGWVLYCISIFRGFGFGLACSVKITCRFGILIYFYDLVDCLVHFVVCV